MVKQQRIRYGQGTVTSLGTAPYVFVQPDGQTTPIPAIAQYVGSAVGDRVTLLTVERTIYATGLII